jgi:hypothetical protein
MYISRESIVEHTIQGQNNKKNASCSIDSPLSEFFCSSFASLLYTSPYLQPVDRLCLLSIAHLPTPYSLTSRLQLQLHHDSLSFSQQTKGRKWSKGLLADISLAIGQVRSVASAADGDGVKFWCIASYITGVSCGANSDQQATAVTLRR